MAYRSAISGRFVTAAKAKRSPKTTIKERRIRCEECGVYHSALKHKRKRA